MMWIRSKPGLLDDPLDLLGERRRRGADVGRQGRVVHREDVREAPPGQSAPQEREDRAVADDPVHEQDRRAGSLDVGDEQAALHGRQVLEAVGRRRCGDRGRPTSPSGQVVTWAASHTASTAPPASTAGSRTPSAPVATPRARDASESRVGAGVSPWGTAAGRGRDAMARPLYARPAPAERATRE